MNKNQSVSSVYVSVYTIRIILLGVLFGSADLYWVYIPKLFTDSPEAFRAAITLLTVFGFDVAACYSLKEDAGGNVGDLKRLLSKIF